MTSLWPSVVSSLDAFVALLDENLRQLEAAKAVDVADIMKHFKLAAESAHNLHALVSSELPDASWQNRQELDLIIQRTLQKTSTDNGVESHCRPED